MALQEKDKTILAIGSVLVVLAAAYFWTWPVINQQNALIKDIHDLKSEMRNPKYNEDDLDAMNNLSFLYLNLDRIDQAEKTCKNILKLNNYSYEANLHLAIIYMSQRQRKKAQEHLENAKTLNPLSPEIISLYKIFKTEFK